MRWFCTLCWIGSLGVLAGCFGPAPIAMPKYSAASIADAAMSAYDTNKDGKVDEAELERCPALKHSLADLDKNGDKAVNRDELEARLSEFLDSKTALLSVSCKVTKEGTPLREAEVKFIPEKFHCNAITAANGKSDAEGFVELRGEGNAHPGVALGFYRVEVSLKDGAGKETIPAQYNAQTTLGYQISTRMRGTIEIAIP